VQSGQSQEIDVVEDEGDRDMGVNLPRSSGVENGRSQLRLTHTVPMHVKKREPETTSELQGAGKNVQDEIREHRGVNLAKW
jgi:hypothetical protein